MSSRIAVFFRNSSDLRYALIIVGLAAVFFGGFLFSNKILYESDQFTGFHCRTLYHSGNLPMWDPMRLGGVPTVDASFGDALYPLIVLQFLMDPYRSLGMKLVVTVMLAGLFMFFMLRRGMGFGQGVSLLGALCYMFSTQFISLVYSGHDGKMYVISMLPLMFWGLLMILDKGRVAGIVAMGIGIGVALLSAQIQVSYMCLWGLFLYFVFFLARRLKQRHTLNSLINPTALFATGIILGLGIGMITFLPPYMYVKQYSVRGQGEKASYEHAASWSLHPEEAVSLVVPFFANFQDKNEGRECYWGRNPFKLNSEYTGMVVLSLGIFFFILYRRQKRFLFWLLMAAAALIYALGATTPLFRLFFYLVPGVKIFRAPSMIMFWFAFSFIMLTVMGMDTFFHDIKKWPGAAVALLKKRLLTAMMIFLLLAVFVTIGQGAVLGLWKAFFVPSAISLEKKRIDHSISEQQYAETQHFIYKCTGKYQGRDMGQKPAIETNYHYFVKGAWIGAVLLCLVFGALYLFLGQHLSVASLVALLCALAVLDLWYLDSHFIKLIKTNDIFYKDDLINRLSGESHRTPFRVLELPNTYPANRLGVWGIQSVGGFHDNELRWYREFRGGQSSENFLYKLREGNINDNPFLNLMNVKYIIYRPQGRGSVSYVENRGCLPRVFVAGHYQVTDTAQMLERLREPGMDYRNTVLLEKEPPDFTRAAGSDSAAPAGTAVLAQYTPDHYVINADMKRPGFLVVSDNYFPAWKAKVNGQMQEIYRADYTLRAIPLTAGQHRVELFYSSRFFELGKRVTVLSFLVMIGISAFLGIRRFRRIQEPAV